MAKNEILKQFSISDELLESELKTALGTVDDSQLETYFQESVHDIEIDSIVQGTVVSVTKDAVMVDVGYKSEGIVPIEHFEDPSSVKEGSKVDVLLEAVEDDEGLVLLSKRKADRVRGWEKVIATHNEGDVVTGKVTRKIKGGLLLDIGVPVFLPASQISIRRVGDVGEYIGRDIECKIIKIDEPRMNIVVSRRKLLEEQREQEKTQLLQEIEVGQVRKGAVKNITDFGAFVDLGGIDGLLHITDMSWGRINHPSEMVKIDDEIDVKVLKVDKERERISLGLKQTQPSPWDTIEEKYPVGSKVKGRVVNVLSYGAFVELEEGIEGLVHVSEMSWTRRINHPSAMVKVNDELEVVVLDIKKDKQEISLGMKQVEINPWTLVNEKYPVGSMVEGTVRNLTNYGAFIELEEGIDGLLHVSDMSWTKKVLHPSELLKKGDQVRAVVLEVDQERKRVALGLKQMEEDPWLQSIPDVYQIGTVVRGVVTKITNFGAFVQLEDDLEGLLHISELSDHKVTSPEECVRVNQKADVKIIKIDSENRKIGLSLKEVTEEDSSALDEAEAAHLANYGEGVTGAPVAAEGTEVSPEALEAAQSADLSDVEREDAAEAEAKAPAAEAPAAEAPSAEAEAPSGEAASADETEEKKEE